MSHFSKKINSSFFLIIGVFLVTGTLAALLTHQSLLRHRATAEQRLTIKAKSASALALKNYNNAVTTLNALKAFFSVSDQVDRASFYDFIDKSSFFDANPGFSTFAYVKKVIDENKASFIDEVVLDSTVKEMGYPEFRITPQGERAEYWPIVYVSPEEKTGFLLGQDQKAESIRSENIGRARDLNTVSLSKQVYLGQGGPGALIAIALYENDKSLESVASRQEAFYGAITSAFLFSDFFRPIYPIEIDSEKAHEIFLSWREEAFTPLFEINDENNSVLTYFFGNTVVYENINLGANEVVLRFSSPVINQLSSQELLEPFLVLILFFAAALVIITFIWISQKVKESKDVKRQYEFISVLSHQLRTPMTSLRWQIESRKVTKKEEKSHRDILQNLSALRSIVQRMLLYIEISSKNANLSKKEWIDIENLYTESLNSVAEFQDISRVKRKSKIKIDKKVFADKSRLTLAMSYLIENALAYSPTNKEVLVEIKLEKNQITVEIIDQGYGIPLTEQEKVFSPFFRASNASLGKNYGSAVSLFMAKKIIEDHGGQIEFESKENEGSTFIVNFPLS